MRIRQNLLFILLACGAANMHAASPSIGFVTAKGSFQLDSSKIWNNATLFDGSVIETSAVPSRIHLSDGSDIQVAAASRVKVFQARTVLEKGAVQVQSSTGYQVEAHALYLAAAAANTVAGVELRANGRVAASASSGEMRITNGERVLVADVTPGKVVTLDPESASKPGLTKLTGCVQGARGGLLLVDQASGVGFELRGEGVEKERGNKVDITGTAEQSAVKVVGATQAIKVVHVDRIGACGGGTGAVARRAGPIGAVAGGVAALGAAVGTAGAVAIIGGVTVAATVGGLEAAGAFSPAASEAQPATSR